MPDFVKLRKFKGLNLILIVFIIKKHTIIQILQSVC